MENTGKDHDLLIEINTKLERAIQDLGELKNTVYKRVDTLEQQKLDKEESNRLVLEANIFRDDHETRIRRVERWGLVACGVVLAVQIIPSVISDVLSILAK